MPIGDWSTSATRCRRSSPVTARCAPGGSSRRALERAARGAVEHVLDQAALARARHAGHGGEPPEREARVHVLEVVVARRPARRGTPSAASRRRSRVDALLAAQVARRLGRPTASQRRAAGARRRAGARRARRRPGPGRRRGRRARMTSGSCSTTTRVFPRPASSRRIADQPVGVARVEPDRRLVEHVERVDQVRARARWPARCAAPRRPRACASRGRASGSRGPRARGSAAATPSSPRTGPAISRPLSAELEPVEPSAPPRRTVIAATSAMVAPAEPHRAAPRAAAACRRSRAQGSARLVAS